MRSLSFLIVAWLASPCMGWSTRDLLQFGSRIIPPAKTRLWYQGEHEHSPEQIVAKTQTINTSFLDPHREELSQWLHTLSQVQRSEPLWVGSDLLHISPSETLQSRLDTMYRGNNGTITLFPPQSVQPRAKFDWDWKYALVKLFTCQEDDWKARNWKSGLSNTHPLRLQLVAIPANTTLPPHVHPAVELDIPLMGTLYEERPTSFTVDPDLLDRAPHHSLGTPLSDFSPQPTPEELTAIHQDLTERVSRVHRWSDLVQLRSFNQPWEVHSVRAGEVLVNSIGSVHRSFTRDEPCLLFVLGPNVHAHFKE